MSLASETGGRPFVGSNRPELQLSQMVKDSSAYYLLGYKSPAPVDGKFHKIKVRLNKDGYEVRARSGYFAPTVGELERSRTAAAGAELPPDIERAIDELAATERSDRPIGFRIGMARGEAGRTRVTIAWAPRTGASKDGEITLTISAASPNGTSYFTASRTALRDVSFEAPPGELVLTTSALNVRGDEIDAEKRRVTVPAFDDARLAIGSPTVFRARTALELRAIADGSAHPEVGREFDRSDRLLVRFPVYGGTGITAAARLLNQRGAEMRALPVAAVADGLYQLDLLLGTAARGDYLIAIEAGRGTETTRALVPIRIR